MNKREPKDVASQLDRLKQNLAGLPENSALNRYFSWLNGQVEHKDALYLKDYAPIIAKEEAHRGEDAPFLSVITRTQGKRPEMLRETLLSLVGQTDEDFEVLLIGHKLDQQQDKLVQQIIGEQPEELRQRIRFIPLNHGTRTTPLNTGFAYAHGQYIAVLDDDDIVFDNWVEEFHKAARKSPGSILHAYVFTQAWNTVATDSGQSALRAAQAPVASHCDKFDLLVQTRENHCPLLSLAFPSFYFQKMGIMFDERLTTTEDWDYFMRTAFIAGVKDVETPTSIYRLWTNAENSSTLHNQQEWAKNYYLIQDKLADMPILIPKGSRKSVAQETMNAINRGWPYRAPRIHTCGLYLGYGGPFSEEHVKTATALSNGISFDAQFPLSEGEAQNLKQIRFDVCDEGMFVVQNVLAMVRYSDGSCDYLSIDDCRSNGAQIQNAICFLNMDPWMVWEIDASKTVQSVRVVGETHANMTPALVRTAAKFLSGAEFQLFYKNDEHGFAENHSKRIYTADGAFELTFPVGEEVTALRLDPGEETGCAVRDLKLEILCEDGKVIHETLSGARTNGVKQSGQIEFNFADPQLIWKLSGQKVREVKASGTFTYLSDDELKRLPTRAAGLKESVRAYVKKERK